MWAKIGIKVNVNAVPRASYFPKVLSYDSSACMVGWGVSTADALFAIQSLTETYDKVKGNGLSNIGRISDPKLDDLIEKIKIEADTAKRNGYINEALTLIRDNVYQLPLHAQVITWAMQKNVDVEQRSDNKLPLERVKVK
jgi:peptide/nickel transport system substrate-binding protein